MHLKREIEMLNVEKQSARQKYDHLKTTVTKPQSSHNDNLSSRYQFPRASHNTQNSHNSHNTHNTKY